MSSFYFTISGRMAGANEIKSANRSHWSVGRKLAKEDLGRAVFAITGEKAYASAHFEHAVGVSFAWFEPNAKRDPDNITSGQKAILDALVMARVIPNDTQRWVKRIEHTINVDKTNPRIEVRVYGIPGSSSAPEEDRRLPWTGPDDQAGPAL